MKTKMKVLKSKVKPCVAVKVEVGKPKKPKNESKVKHAMHEFIKVEKVPSSKPMKPKKK